MKYHCDNCHERFELSQPPACLCPGCTPDPVARCLVTRVIKIMERAIQDKECKDEKGRYCFVCDVKVVLSKLREAESRLGEHKLPDSGTLGGVPIKKGDEGSVDSDGKVAVDIDRDVVGRLIEASLVLIEYIRSGSNLKEMNAALLVIKQAESQTGEPAELEFERKTTHGMPFGCFLKFKLGDISCKTRTYYEGEDLEAIADTLAKSQGKVAVFPKKSG